MVRTAKNSTPATPAPAKKVSTKKVAAPKVVAPVVEAAPVAAAIEVPVENTVVEESNGIGVVVFLHIYFYYGLEKVVFICCHCLRL